MNTIDPLDVYLNDVLGLQLLNINKSSMTHPKVLFFQVGSLKKNHSHDDDVVGPEHELLEKIKNAMKLKKNEVIDFFCQEWQADKTLHEFNKIITDNHIQVIVAMGDFAASQILNKSATVAESRKKSYQYLGKKTYITYSPEHLLNHPENKKDTWEDLKMVLEELKL